MEPFNNKVQRKSEVNIKQLAEDNWKKRDPRKESDTDSAILVKSPLNRMIESLIPVHKNIIIGRKFIAVDYFTASDLCKYHFLTHAHPDRLIHLNSKWEEPIYCSELTAKIIPIVMGKNNGVNLELLRPLKVGCTHTIDCNLKVRWCKYLILIFKFMKFLYSVFEIPSPFRLISEIEKILTFQCTYKIQNFVIHYVVYLLLNYVEGNGYNYPKTVNKSFIERESANINSFHVEIVTGDLSQRDSC
uniref:THAP-type domain-containing protein n=1 Tax=Heterorhabditis bacteriophora TaxID=37862 RepID=A0A1I7X3M3_HETBA